MRTVRSSGRRVEGVYPNMHWSGGVYPACTGRSGVHHPMDRMTDACENITLPQLDCGQ